MVCFFVANICAQEKRITLQGKILSEDLPIADIHIFNKNSSRGTVSNAAGVFEIPVKENDTLVFSGIQFYTLLFPITGEIVKIKQLTVNLLLKINELPEVELKKYNLNGSLLTDRQKVPDSISKINPQLLKPDAWDVNFNLADDYDKVDRVRPPDASALTNPNIPVGGNILGLLSYVTEPLLKEIKKIGKEKRDIKYKDFVAQQKAALAKENIRTEFGDAFFTNTLKIPAPQIESFLNYCESKGIYDLYAKDKKIEILDILITESENYRKNY